MDAVLWVILGVVVLALIAVVAVGVIRRRRSQQLHDRFGPEYERTVERAGDRRAAEADLAARSDRREALDIRSLAPEARERYARVWQEIQRRFVDEPETAVADADRAIVEVMAERGYPIEDFDRRAADVSVDHPGVVENYRAAHAISERNSTGDATTEDLRQAMVHYRALFDELLGNGHRDATESQASGKVRS
jgi:hypothetical protein